MYQQEKGEKGEVRIENLEELVTATKQFTKPDEAEDLSDLTAFLTMLRWKLAKRKPLRIKTMWN